MEILMLIQKIISMAVQLSNTTEHDVFANYYGHANILKVDIFYNGWKENKESTTQYEVYISIDDNVDTKLADILENLTELYMKEARKIVENI